MISAVLILLLGCVIVLITIAAGGYFVAQEFAYMSADRNKLRTLAANGDKAAQRAVKVTERTSFMLSGAQLGITVTGLIVGYVAEPLVGQSLGTLLGGVGIPAALSITLGTVLALVVATVVQMIFAELFPKNYAIANPIPLARWLASSTLVYLKVFGWLIKFFDVSAEALLRLLRIEPVHDVDSSATSSDLEHIVESSHRTGNLPRNVYLTVDRVLDFPDHTVEHAMVPRSKCGTVRPDTPVSQLRGLMAREHTRYPVVSEEDEAIGVVHLTDVLAHAPESEETAETLMRTALTVPTAMTLPEALDELERTGGRMACVVNEYGGFAGIITLEDLAEEIFGEITDEHDPAPSEHISMDAPGLWTVDASLPVDEVERTVDHELPTGDFETLAGLIIAHTRRLPLPGERITVSLPETNEDLDEEPQPLTMTITVLKVARKVPQLVQLDFPEESSPKTPVEGTKGADAR